MNSWSCLTENSRDTNVLQSHSSKSKTEHSVTLSIRELNRCRINFSFCLLRHVKIYPVKSTEINKTTAGFEVQTTQHTAEYWRIFSEWGLMCQNQIIGFIISVETHKSEHLYCIYRKWWKNIRSAVCCWCLTLNHNKMTNIYF